MSSILVTHSFFTRATFWKGIFKYIDTEESGYSSFVNGWILKFFPYLSIGEKMEKNRAIFSQEEKIYPKEISNGISKTDMKWTYFFEELEMQLLAGFFGMTQDKKTKTLHPEIAWAIRTKEAGEAFDKSLDF